MIGGDPGNRHSTTSRKTYFVLGDLLGGYSNRQNPISPWYRVRVERLPDSSPGEVLPGDK